MYIREFLIYKFLLISQNLRLKKKSEFKDLKDYLFGPAHVPIALEDNYLHPLKVLIESFTQNTPTISFKKYNTSKPTKLDSKKKHPWLTPQLHFHIFVFFRIVLESNSTADEDHLRNLKS